MNVSDAVAAAAHLTPHKVAIVFDGVSLTYGELNRRANRVAQGLLNLGIRRGDRVALLLPNQPEFAVAWLAAQKLGAVALSLEPASSPQQLERAVSLCGARVLFTVASLASQVPWARCPSLVHAVSCQGAFTAAVPVSMLESLVASGQDALKATNMAGDEPSVILYTSGATGPPKAVVLSHANVTAGMRAMVQHTQVKTADVLALFLPLTQVMGQVLIMGGAFEAAATLVMFGSFQPLQVLPVVEKQWVTHFFGVPEVYSSLLDAGLPREKFDSVRYFFSAGARLAPRVAQAWIHVLQRLVYEGYTLTEASGLVCFNHDRSPLPGSLGGAVADTRVVVRDSLGKALPAGHTGELWVQGPGVMTGYWQDPAATSQVLKGKWLRTGDVGRMDEKGYFFWSDRVEDLVTADTPWWPSQVEKVLLTHPGIAQVAVFGVPQAGKPLVQAAVVVRPGASVTLKDVQAHCQHLEKHQVPTGVELMRQLPKNACGCVLKRVLQERALQSGPA